MSEKLVEQVLLDVHDFAQSHNYWTDGLIKTSQLTLTSDDIIWGEFNLSIDLSEDDLEGDIEDDSRAILTKGNSHASIDVSERLFLLICNSLTLNRPIKIILGLEALVENDTVVVNRDGDTIWLIKKFKLDSAPAAELLERGDGDSSISYAETQNLEFVGIPRWSTEKVVAWLKSTVSENEYHASEVRQKYEKLWSTQSRARRTAVAAFGKCARTLREIFLEGSDKDRYLCARNPLLGTFSELDEPRFENKVLGRDEALQWLIRDEDLIVHLFRNPHLDLEFIEMFFRSDQPPSHLKIQAIRAITDTEGFQERFSNDTPATREKRGAVEAIIEFIFSCPFDSDVKKSMRDVTFSLFPVGKFLSCTADVQLYISHFAPAKLDQYEEQSFVAAYGSTHWDFESSDELAKIRAFLISRVLEQKNKETADYIASVCKNSTDESLRSNYFTYAPLEEIFYQSFWYRLPPVRDIFDEELSFEEDESGPPTGFDRGQISHIREFIADPELGRAIIGIAFQRRFYKSEKHFRWLKDFCKACDEHFMLMPSHVPVFGTASATEIFESMAERVLSQYPDEAVDPSAIKEMERMESVVAPIVKEVQAFGERLAEIDEATTSVYTKVKSIEGMARAQNEAVNNIGRIAEDVSELKNQYSQVSERLTKATRGFFRRFS
ncbi:hypothetical protein N9O71_01830 [bacterium]|nr:hypothetical protein [bacterium]